MASIQYAFRWFLPFVLCIGVWLYGMGRHAEELYVGVVFCAIIGLDILSHSQLFSKLESAAYDEESEYVLLFWRFVLNSCFGLCCLFMVLLRGGLSAT